MADLAVRHVFLYGTLRHLPLLSVVLGRIPPSTALVPATVDDMLATWVAGAHYPMIATRPGHTAQGLLLKDLSEDDIARIDFYEGGFGYDLIPVKTSEGPAMMYWPGPDVGPAGDPFLLDDWVAQFGDVSVFAAEEVMAYHGLRSAEDVVAMTPRILSRAYARQRAARNAPTEFDGQVELQHVDVRYSDFFAMRGHVARLETFSGEMSPPMDRAIFWANDAALVLPYDPVRDRVMVLEQGRLGPLTRGDRRIWNLEPAAGIIDPGETPEEAAIRETAEETGLTVQQLEPVSFSYPSPGTSSEFYYAYVGLCDIPDGAAGVTGVAHENEDIRTHILSFDTFMTYIDTGRICIMPLVLLGHWLARNRDRLRAA